MARYATLVDPSVSPWPCVCIDDDVCVRHTSMSHCRGPTQPYVYIDDDCVSYRYVTLVDPMCHGHMSVLMIMSVMQVCHIGGPYVSSWPCVSVLMIYECHTGVPC